MKAAARLMMIVALCLSLGFHWLALQSVAWTTMLVSNMRQAPLCQAVIKTFDGSHPCNLCHAVASGSKSEKKSDTLPAVAKMDLIVSRQIQAILPPWRPYNYAVTADFVPERFIAPPSPPPRDPVRI
jgi:hypothetical protein